jgi:hypothetical protein
VVLAQQMGVVSSTVAVSITLTALITIVVSTYLMNYDDQLYRLLKGPLSIFERAETKEELQALSHYPLILLGYQRGGHEFIKTFRQMKKPYVVVDYDPTVIDVLEHQHINHLYGDATDLELLDELGIHQSELVISTIADFDTNKMLLKHIWQKNKRARFICHAASYTEAQVLYEHKAAFVLLDHYLGSEHVNSLIRTSGTSLKAFEEYRRHQAKSLSNALKTQEDNT